MIWTKADKTRKVADRIKEMNFNILAVQEVEDIDTLREFNRDQLNGRYPFFALVEGNDPRLIDIGILSNLPIGAVTSWQHAIHADEEFSALVPNDWTPSLEQAQTYIEDELIAKTRKNQRFLPGP